MKKVKNILFLFVFLSFIFLNVTGSFADGNTDPDPSEKQMTNEVHDGTVVRFFRKFSFGSGSSELQDLPMHLNVKDNKTGKIFESLAIAGVYKEGDQVKYYLKGDKIMVVETNAKKIEQQPSEILTGTVIRFFRKFTFGSGSTEVNELPMLVNVKESQSGTVYESLPLKTFIKEGDVVKFYKKGDKVVVIEN